MIFPRGTEADKVVPPVLKAQILVQLYLCVLLWFYANEIF